MYRIAILGSENSHATRFSTIFHGLEPACKTKYPDFKVIGSYSAYEGEAQKLVDNCGVEIAADSPYDFLGKVDAIMVTARDGKFHAEYARPYIEAGIPAFIDKPFTNDNEEALALARLAKSKGVPLVGGSSLKLAYDVQMLRHAREYDIKNVIGGFVASPVNMENIYGGFYFYASHLVEISMSVFGCDPKSIRAIRTRGGVIAIAHYDTFDVINQFNDGNYEYSVTITGKETTMTRDIFRSLNYQLETAAFVEMLRTGKMSHTYEELIAPVYYMNAIKESYENGGKEVELSFPEV